MTKNWIEERDSLCLKVQNKFDIAPFSNKDLPIIALTSNDRIAKDEKFKNMKIDGQKDLATIGDKVIDYIIFEHFSQLGKTAKELNNYREKYGNNWILHDLSKIPEIDLKDDIFWSGNDKCSKTGKKCLAVYFEAFIGAIFIDKGIEEVKKFFDTLHFLRM